MPNANLPGFTAEAAIARTRHPYQSTSRIAPGTGVVPQLAPGTGTTTAGGWGCAMCVTACTWITGDVVACFTACQDAGACGTIALQR